MTEDESSYLVIGKAIEVHKEFKGPGLLESVYESALAWELEQIGLEVARQVAVPVVYKGHTLDAPMRLDLLVGGKLVVECKATSKDNPVFCSQTLTYLRASGFKLGLVINFGLPTIRAGLHRVVNDL